MTTEYQARKASRLHAMFVDRRVVERMGDKSQGVVCGVTTDGLLRVQWARRIGLHTEDEIERLDVGESARDAARLPAVQDAFADVRAFLPISDDDTDTDD